MPAVQSNALTTSFDLRNAIQWLRHRRRRFITGKCSEIFRSLYRRATDVFDFGTVVPKSNSRNRHVTEVFGSPQRNRRGSQTKLTQCEEQLVSCEAIVHPNLLAQSRPRA